MMKYLMQFSALSLIVIGLVLPSSAAQASLGKTAEVVGIIASFDAATVKLYVKGQFIVVKRSEVETGVKIKVGNEITAIIPVNREPASTKNK